jgi:hypothetical protein
MLRLVKKKGLPEEWSALIDSLVEACSDENFLAALYSGWTSGVGVPPSQALSRAKYAVDGLNNPDLKESMREAALAEARFTLVQVLETTKGFVSNPSSHNVGQVMLARMVLGHEGRLNTPTPKVTTKKVKTPAKKTKTPAKKTKA